MIISYSYEICPKHYEKMKMILLLFMHECYNPSVISFVQIIRNRITRVVENLYSKQRKINNYFNPTETRRVLT